MSNPQTTFAAPSGSRAYFHVQGVGNDGLAATAIGPSNSLFFYWEANDGVRRRRLTAVHRFNQFRKGDRDS